MKEQTGEREKMKEKKEVQYSGVAQDHLTNALFDSVTNIYYVN